MYRTHRSHTRAHTHTKVFDLWKSRLSSGIKVKKPHTRGINSRLLGMSRVEGQRSLLTAALLLLSSKSRLHFCIDCIQVIFIRCPGCWFVSGTEQTSAEKSLTANAPLTEPTRRPQQPNLGPGRVVFHSISHRDFKQIYPELVYLP